jgi:hypothetical protein
MKVKDYEESHEPGRKTPHQKSLRAVAGKTADRNEIAKDCITFANATGGHLLLCIENGQDAPPERGAVRFEGNNRWRRYWATPCQLSDNLRPIGDSWAIDGGR